jgi:hypothetical protein
MTFLDSDVAIRQTALQLIQHHDENEKRISDAYDLLIEADVATAQFFRGNFNHAKYYTPLKSDKEKALKNLRVSAWKAIVDQMGLHKFMSMKREKAFEENCEKGDLPPVTDVEVFSFLQDMLNNAHEIALESVQELYAWLRPGARSHDPYKTNQQNARWKLGKKIILASILNIHYGGKFWVNVYREENVRQLDRIFHLLDGSGVMEGYRSPLVDAINTCTTSDNAAETDYFSFRCFQNGNLHLTFKRLDLVERLNAAAGGGHILGDG